MLNVSISAAPSTMGATGRMVHSTFMKFFSENNFANGFADFFADFFAYISGSDQSTTVILA